MYSGADYSNVAVLEGHEGPVQAVLALPDGTLLSGGSDGTIKLWSDNKCQHTFKGHTDTVRRGSKSMRLMMLTKENGEGQMSNMSR